MKGEKSKVRWRWRLFQAKDFHTLMGPSFFLCFVLGIFPYRTDSSNFFFSKSRFLCSTICIVIYVCYLVVVLYQINYSGTLKYDSIPGQLQGNFYMLLGGVITVVTYILCRPRMQVLQNLADVSERLPPEVFYEMARWMHAKDILGFLFLLVQIPNVFSENIYQALSNAQDMYTLMVVLTMDMFYMNCVCVLKACFGRINESLVNLKEILITDEPHLLRRIYHEQRNPLLLIELRALKKRHLVISDVVHRLNITFSLQIITTVVMTFAEITFSLYFYILQWKGIKEINVEKQIFYSYFIMPALFFSVKIMLMVWACETGKDQALKIGTNIHEVLISTTDKQVKDELEIFSLQVLHRDNIFSAKGLTMGAALLTEIVGGITTYLLILIQFLGSKQHDNQTETMR